MESLSVYVDKQNRKCPEYIFCKLYFKFNNINYMNYLFKLKLGVDPLSATRKYFDFLFYLQPS